MYTTIPKILNAMRIANPNKLLNQMQNVNGFTLYKNLTGQKIYSVFYFCLINRMNIKVLIILQVGDLPIYQILSQNVKA